MLHVRINCLGWCCSRCRLVTVQDFLEQDCCLGSWMHTARRRLPTMTRNDNLKLSGTVHSVDTRLILMEFCRLPGRVFTGLEESCHVIHQGYSSYHGQLEVRSGRRGCVSFRLLNFPFVHDLSLNFDIRSYSSPRRLGSHCHNIPCQRP